MRGDGEGKGELERNNQIIMIECHGSQEPEGSSQIGLATMGLGMVGRGFCNTHPEIIVASIEMADTISLLDLRFQTSRMKG